jgi:hypothetical protein
VHIKRAKRKAKPDNKNQSRLWPLTQRLAVLMMFAALNAAYKAYRWILLKGCHLFADTAPARRINYAQQRKRQRRQGQRKRSFNPRSRAAKPKHFRNRRRRQYQAF